MNSPNNPLPDLTGKGKSGKPASRFSIRVAMVLGLLVLGGLFWYASRLCSLELLAQRETELRATLAANPWLVGLAGVGVYLLMAGFSLPGAALMTILYGWYFGFWTGLLVVSFGSTAGATLAFLASRHLLRDWVEEKLGGRFSGFNPAFDQEGPFYLFILRLIPAVPFFVINLLMGLTRIPTRTFWWVSQLGMLPGTAAYVYFGSRIPGLKTIAEGGIGQVLSWQLLVAFAIVGLLPLILKRVVDRWRPPAVQPGIPSDTGHLK
jgi:uncharacterized membrane protein YdjX (TVP38/TMEM64 family)